MPNDIQASRKGSVDSAFIFVSGGVISSVGKGITSATLAALLKARGITAIPVKCDAYLNVDAGTIRPQEHGEVFVMDKGAETDQDLGNYERFLDETLPDRCYVTNGQIYQTIINKERNFEFEGEDVEIAVHVPEEIIHRLEEVAKLKKADVVICEIGGTVGEYQNMLFVEANRIMKYRHGRRVAHVHVAYLPTPPSVGEMKSKPVQNSVRQLIASGIQPDFLLGRAEQELDDRRRDTLSWTCNIPKDHIISAPNVDSIYQVPLNFDRQGLADKLVKVLGLKAKKKNLKPWEDLNKRIVAVKKQEDALKIAVVGKYFETGNFKLADVYVSVVEALKHASWSTGKKIELSWVSSLDVEKHGAKQILSGFNGIVVPGGFGSRGTEGMIETVKYARENNLPYLGLCYGMQMAVIEFARNVLKLAKANTTEVDPKTKYPVIHIMPDQEKKLLKREYGASMRLGAWECLLKAGSQTAQAYKEYGFLKGKSLNIQERHRHRYEFNNDFRDSVEQAGLQVVGTSPDGKLVEVVELKGHPFFVATQYHPEFLSRPLSPHPLFASFIKACRK